jgi:CRP-like cAMP-binding protein
MDPARLDAIPTFAALDEDVRGRLASVMKEVSVEAGATLATEREFAYEMFAIEEGEAEVRKDGDLLRSLRAGDVFGEIALLASGRRTATVTATTPMRLLTLFTRDLQRLERRTPEVAEALRAVMRERMPRESA